MFSIHSPQYSQSDALNSLITKCIHVLCLPIDYLKHDRLLKHNLNVNNDNNQHHYYYGSSLYDLNLLNRFDTSHHDDNDDTNNIPCRLLQCFYENNKSNVKCLLDINSRQSIIDYLIRERIKIQAKFLLNLLEDGGLFNLDLWQLSEINSFSPNQIEQILMSMYEHSYSFRKLSLGGACWMYNDQLVNGVLKKFLCYNRNLINLKELKIQHLTSEIDMNLLFGSCKNLTSLEIAEPSISNDDIIKMTQIFDYDDDHSIINYHSNIRKTLKHVTLPSSVQEVGIMYFLAHFPNITHLRCTPFEQLLDLLENSHNVNPKRKNLIDRTEKVLTNLRALSIAHPMSRNMVDCLLRKCVHIEELSLELQKYMSLSSLATRKHNIHRLELHNSSNESINFIDHIVPILEHCGRQLKILSFINFDYIDLTKLIELCPNLKSLSIQCFKTINYRTFRPYSNWFNVINDTSNCKSTLQSLEYLRLRPRPNYSLPADICISLLKQCVHLKHLQLYCCQELTDYNIDRIIESNQLQQLQTFILRHVHNVTNIKLCKLLSSSIFFNNLVIHDCGLIPHPPHIKHNFM